MKFIRYTSFVVLAGLLLFAGYSLGHASTPQSATQQESKEYPLLAKRLFIDNPNDTRINFSGLRTQLNDYFKKNSVEGTLYFEYLPTGTNVRINGDQRYTAASLIKLPVAMEYYKAVEIGKIDPNLSVSLKQEWLDDEFGDLYKKGAGHTLTMQEAVTIMLKNSDNTALRAILETNTNNLSSEERALNSLDIEYNINGSDQTLQIGTRSYSSFLKCLYYACYNTKEHSQDILNILSDTSFSNRIAGGIPDKDIKVAHKVGVFNTKVQGDCGIVYAPSSNYVLCIMIEGDDIDSTNKHFVDISRIVYDFIATKD